LVRKTACRITHLYPTERDTMTDWKSIIMQQIYRIDFPWNRCNDGGGI